MAIVKKAGHKGGARNEKLKGELTNTPRARGNNKIAVKRGRGKSRNSGRGALVEEEKSNEEEDSWLIVFRIRHLPAGIVTETIPFNQK